MQHLINIIYLPWNSNKLIHYFKMKAQDVLFACEWKWNKISEFIHLQDFYFTFIAILLLIDCNIYSKKTLPAAIAYVSNKIAHCGPI